MITRILRIIFAVILFASAPYMPAAPTMRLHSTSAATGTTNLCSLRDKYGFLWVGTNSGLACFDGNGTPANRNMSGIVRSTSNLRVNTLFEYGDDIWIGSSKGLVVYDRLKNNTYRFPYKTKYNVEIASRIDRILDAGNGKIWIMTQGQGIFIFDTKNKRLSQDSRHGSFFSDAALGGDGFVYAAGMEGNIKKFRSDGEFVSQSVIPGYIPNKTRISLQAHSGIIWISSGSDIYSLDVASGTIAPRVSTLPYGSITAILLNSPSSMIVATFSALLHYDMASGSLSPIEVSENMFRQGFSPRVNQLAKDSDGNVIVTGSLGEVALLSPVEDAFRFVGIDNPSIPQNPVGALGNDNRRHGLWIGSESGINHYDLTTGALTTPVIPGLRGEAVSSITPHGDLLWIGTARNGLVRYNTATGESQRFRYSEDVPYSLISDEVTDVFVTSTGETFVLTQWGICSFEPEKSEFHTFPEIGQQTQVITMAEDNDGGLWASSLNDGLFYRKAGDNRFCIFRSDALDRKSVTILLLARDGSIWAATNDDGIYRFDKDAADFRKIDIPLLSKRTVYTMEEDSDGSIWIATGEALVQVAPDGKMNFNLCRALSHNPVLRSSAKLSSGELAIGCTNGVRIFDPHRMRANDGKIRTYPTTISFPFMDNDEESLEKIGVNVLLYTQDKITLPFDHNTFTIHLSSTHPAELPFVNYDYMLRGVDKDWNVGTSREEVTYSNLRPGTYQFMVRPTGLKDAETSALTICVSPPWYLSIWAYIVYGILLLMAALVITFLTRRSIRRHYNRRIDDLKARKEREVWEAKMKFFVDLVHEIRTPLMLISLPLEHISKRFREFSISGDHKKDSLAVAENMKASRKYLFSMQNNLDYLLGITNQLLDFRKIDNNTETELSISRCNLNQMLAEICGRFKNPMQTEGKEISLSLPQDDVIAYLDGGKTDRVLMNLLGNARKYCRSKVDVVLSTKDDKVEITISDDGPGVPENERGNVFNYYYQIKGDRVGASLGTGLGLAYAKLVADNHHGEIMVEESMSGGAAFRLVLPLGDPSDVKDKSAEDTPIPYSGNTYSGEYTADSANSEPDKNGVSEDPIWKENTVLVVDDNKELLDMICEGLEPSYNVITAGNGIEALERLKDNDVDFIVSDVMMPEMDGIELLRNVKGNIETSHIPFIILTAKTSHEARAEGMDQGADIYLDKPFSIHNLMMQIENIRRTRQFFYARRRGSEPLPEIDKAQAEAVKEEKLPVVNKYDAEFLRKMNETMEENTSNEEFSIDDLAESLNMSRSSFYRKLKALMGMTPVDYMKNFRLDSAARQLREGARVTEVSANVGFTSSSYFAKCFREKYGVLPRDYVASLNS